jgi:branched-chain amino acid transport system ATP-binding protein
MLELKNLSAAYGRIEAIKSVSLNVEQGEIVALLGANGAGKTTTLRCVSGLLKPSGGDISFRGERIGKASAEKIVAMRVGHVPEGRKIFPRLTVEENLDVGAYLLSDRNLVAARKDGAFELFPILKKRRSQKGGTLSGGEQQMLAIGRALMQDPELLLLDEPSMGLAPVMVDLIFEVIKSLNAKGKTILLVEQNARMALAISHRAYLMRTGCVVMSGASKDLAANPEVQEAYLGGG